MKKIKAFSLERAARCSGWSGESYLVVRAVLPRYFAAVISRWPPVSVEAVLVRSDVAVLHLQLSVNTPIDIVATRLLRH